VLGWVKRNYFEDRIHRVGEKVDKLVVGVDSHKYLIEERIGWLEIRDARSVHDAHGAHAILYAHIHDAHGYHTPDNLIVCYFNVPSNFDIQKEENLFNYFENGYYFDIFVSCSNYFASYFGR